MSWGCAKHGMAIHTGKDFKGNIAIGWGPSSVIDADIAGEYTMCIPSKSALKGEINDVWCADWMTQHITHEGE